MSTLAWTTIILADLQQSRAAPLISAAQSSVLASGQADPIPGLIAIVVGELRGAIGFSGKYALSTTASTLPPNVKPDAVDAIVRRCLKRLNAALYTEADRDDERTYQSRLGLIREGRYPIDAPADPMGSNPSAPTGRVGFNAGDTRLFTTTGLRNL